MNDSMNALSVGYNRENVSTIVKILIFVPIAVWAFEVHGPHRPVHTHWAKVAASESHSLPPEFTYRRMGGGSPRPATKEPTAI